MPPDGGVGGVCRFPVGLRGAVSGGSSDPSEVMAEKRAAAAEAGGWETLGAAAAASAAAAEAAEAVAPERLAAAAVRPVYRNLRSSI